MTIVNLNEDKKLSKNILSVVFKLKFKITKDTIELIFLYYIKKKFKNLTNLPIAQLVSEKFDEYKKNIINLSLLKKKNIKFCTFNRDILSFSFVLLIVA